MSSWTGGSQAPSQLCLPEAEASDPYLVFTCEDGACGFTMEQRLGTHRRCCGLASDPLHLPWEFFRVLGVSAREEELFNVARGLPARWADVSAQ